MFITAPSYVLLDVQLKVAQGYGINGLSHGEESLVYGYSIERFLEERSELPERLAFQLSSVSISEWKESDCLQGLEENMQRADVNAASETSRSRLVDECMQKLQVHQ
ncbi:hypothetical protein MMC19_001070, partial [Ptychographa xylographoides]|nr:hypothetical protein [Ptychographa xylographoides]